MTDQELLAAIRADFQAAYRSSRKIRALLEKVQEGTATYAEAQQYAIEVSKLIGTVWRQHYAEFSDEQARTLADQMLPSVLDDNYSTVADYTKQVQAALNQKAKIGLKVQTPPPDTDRVDGLRTMLEQAESYAAAEPQLMAGMENYTQHVVDEFVRRNFEAQAKAGLSPTLIRRADAGACRWCLNLAGAYDYPVDNTDVYRRHENCHCVVEYRPGDGRRQNVHTKRWTEDAAPDKIETRKRITVHPDRLKTPQQRNFERALAEQSKDDRDSTILGEAIQQNHTVLARYTPKEMKDALEKAGFETRPLGHGSLKGVPFEEGGGYRINFGGNGYFQYHPAKGSHHNGAYWKVSTSKGGVKRYDTRGEEIPD